MASFCSKCGAALTPDRQFCAACGTPVTPVASPVGVGVPLNTPPPPAFVQVKSGTSAVKVILIVVAVVVVLGILGVGAFGFFVWRIAHSARVSGPNGQVTVNVPGGSITTNPSDSFSTSDLGTDVYPGAEPGKGSMRMSLPNGSMVTAVYVTSDSKDQVVAFYKGKFGSGTSIFDNAKTAILTLNKANHESVMVTVSANSSEYGGKTQIHIVHSTSNTP